LFLLAIGLILAPFGYVFVIFDAVSRLGRISQNLVGVQAVFYVQMFGNLALLACGIWAAILFFQKTESAPRTVIILLSAHILLDLVQAIMIASMSHAPDSMGAFSVPCGSFIYCGIWIPYFCVSRRVKGTFIN
jgi:hypothetical protein